MPDSTPAAPVTDRIPVTKEIASSTTLDVVASLIGKPPAPKVDQSTPPVVPPTTPPVAPPAAPPKPVASAKPSAPAIPKVLFDKVRTKTPVAQPVAPPPTDFDPDSVKLEDLDENVRPNFARLRDKYSFTAKELADVKKERDELKARTTSTADPKELETLKTENQKLMDNLGKISLEADPRFQARWGAQMAPVEQTVKNVLRSYDVKDMKVDDVVEFLKTLPAKDRPEFLASQLPEEVVATATATLLPMLGQLDVVQTARKQELENFKQTTSVLDKQQQDQQVLQVTAMRESVKRDAVKDLAQEEILLQRVDGNEEWNKGVDALMLGVETVFQANDPMTHAKALVASRLMPVYKLMFFEERSRREAMEAALTARNIALPNVGDSSQSQDESMRVKGPMTAEEAVARVTSRMRRS